jgi:hypothetical protein
MQIAITKQRDHDRIVVIRADGTGAETTFPKKGTVPHDAVHWFVERELGLAHGFWGMVAAGRHPEEISEIAKAAGHASAKRAQLPGATIVELLQAERLVECFEADLWSPGGTAEALIDLARTACGYSHVPLPALDPARVEAIRRGLGKFAQDWIAAPLGHVARLEWE